MMDLLFGWNYSRLIINGLMLLAASFLLIVFPEILSWFVAFFMMWAGLVMVGIGVKNWYDRRKRKEKVIIYW